MSVSSRRFHGFLIVPLLACAGCTSYRADPLDTTAELAAYARRDLTTATAPLATTAPVDLSTGLREEHLVAIALRQHPDLAIVRARRGLADAVLIEAGLWPNPELSLAVRGGSPGVTADLDLLAAVLRPGERTAKRSAAEAGQREALAEVAQVEWRVVADVRRARLEIIAAVARHRAATDTASLTHSAAEGLGRRHALGDATELDLATARADAAAADRALRESGAAVAAQERALNRLLGVPTNVAVPIAGRNDPLAMIDAAGVVPSNSATEALQGRWDLAGAHAAYDRADQELRLAIAKQYPALRIGPSASRDGDGTTIGGVLALELPLFNRNQGGIRAAQATRDEMRARYQALLQEALGQVADATAELRQGTADVAAIDADLMPAARRALDLADRAVQAREMGLIDYLAVRRVWLDAQRARLDAVAAMHRARISLDVALGRGAAGMARPNQPNHTPAAGATP